MGLDGRFGNAEFVSDLLVQQAIADHRQDAELLRSEAGQSGAGRLGFPTDIRFVLNVARPPDVPSSTARTASWIVSSELDLGMKPLAPNSRERATTAASS